MNTEAIKEIANQLGIAVSAVTKDVIPAYASYVIAVYASRVIILAILAIALLVVARFCMAKSKEYSDWEKLPLTEYQKSCVRNKYEALEATSYVCYGLSAVFVGIAVIAFDTIILWVFSPYGAFINLLMPH